MCTGLQCDFKPNAHKLNLVAPQGHQLKRNVWNMPQTIKEN